MEIELVPSVGSLMLHCTGLVVRIISRSRYSARSISKDVLGNYRKNIAADIFYEFNPNIANERICEVRTRAK